MSCWSILEQKARAERNRIAEDYTTLRTRIDEQQSLLDRTVQISMQYQSKIELLQTGSALFADIQLYRSSLKQMQQAKFQIESQLKILVLEGGRFQRRLQIAEVERQKFEKLIDREKLNSKRLAEKLDALDMDDLGIQLFQRKKKLA